MIVKNSHRYTIIIIICIIMSLLSGCWDRRELNQRAFVSGVGLDAVPASSKDEIQVTVQIIDPTQIQSPQSGSAGEKPFWLATISAPTVFSAIRDVTKVSARRLFFEHSQILVLGERIARQGVKQHLDLFVRDYQPREISLIAVTEGKAKDLLSKETPMIKISAFYLNKILEEQPSSDSKTVAVDFLTFTNASRSNTTSPVAPMLKLDNDQLRIVGTAVFDTELKMTGRLNDIESRGLLWVRGEVKSCILDVQIPGYVNYFSLELLKQSSQIIPQFKDGKPVIKVKINVESNLGAAADAVDLLNPDLWPQLEKAQADKVGQEIYMSIDKAQTLNADVFAFGEAFHKKYPQRWKQLEPAWDKVFPELEVSVEVDSRLRRPGLITKSYASK